MLASTLSLWTVEGLTVSGQGNMWVSLQKPSMLACKVWLIFQSLKSHNSVNAHYNATKFAL